MNNLRLLTIAELLKGSDKVIDVGCDHAYLCIELLRKQYVNYVYNVDINQKPLEQGMLNSKKLLSSNNYEFILNKGLENLTIEADAISISGMGAKNIISIIENSTIKPKFYVIQANNNSYLIREYIKNNNGIILDEIIVFEDNHYYEIIKFSLNNLKTNINNKRDLYLGVKFIQNHLTINYFKNRYFYLKNIYSDKLSNNLKEELFILEKYLLDNNL
ncbi:MAG: class I SAM-dependent methyltransferase [Ureaplasma sp.]|nr:class I SAM-dependent methyltransferase [Ureaplasma sp.]